MYVCTRMYVCIVWVIMMWQNIRWNTKTKNETARTCLKGLSKQTKKGTQKKMTQNTKAQQLATKKKKRCINLSSLKMIMNGKVVIGVTMMKPTEARQSQTAISNNTINMAKCVYFASCIYAFCACNARKTLKTSISKGFESSCILPSCKLQPQTKVTFWQLRVIKFLSFSFLLFLFLFLHFHSIYLKANNP